MPYIEDSLSAGEQIVGFFRLHWISRSWMALWIVLAIPTVGITLILALYEFFRLRYIEQGVTNKRVIYKKGIISRTSEEMKLNSIETVEIDQGISGRIFGFGDVTVTGRGLSTVVFRTVEDPMAVKRQIESVSNPVA
ncbi:MAG: PH domain-containing protein [Betaproteobacteria bacterium]